MKYLLSVLWLAAVGTATAQGSIYVCGSRPNLTYTNSLSPAEARAKGCKTISGGNITVIEGTRPAASTKVATATQSAPKIDNPEQRARDSDARLILENELKKTQARQAELLKDYNNGEPEKRGDEARNHQKYLDRVAELKDSIKRTEEDMAGLKRELARLPAAK